METSDEWITQRSGISERRWADASDATSDLAVRAAEAALKSARMEIGEIDCIVAATLSPDVYFPGIGVFIQTKLGAAHIPALDVRNQCSGFLYGLSVAAAYVRSGMYRNVLVVGAELQSKALDLSTRGRDVSVLFGDGAGAVVVAASAAGRPYAGRIGAIELHADGAHADRLVLAFPGTRHKKLVHNDLLERDEVYPVMDGRVVFKHAVQRVPEVIASVCRAAARLFKISTVLCCTKPIVASMKPQQNSSVSIPKKSIIRSRSSATHLLPRFDWFGRRAP